MRRRIESTPEHVQTFLNFTVDKICEREFASQIPPATFGHRRRGAEHLYCRSALKALRQPGLNLPMYASVKVIPNKKAATVARVFEEEFLDRHGCPFEVVTNQGTEFNAEFSDLLTSAGLRHVRVLPKNPQANGQVERFMQILKSTLRATCHEHPSD